MMVTKISISQFMTLRIFWVDMSCQGIPRLNTYVLNEQIIGFIVGTLPQLRNSLIGSSAPLRVVQDSASLLGYIYHICPFFMLCHAPFGTSFIWVYVSDLGLWYWNIISHSIFFVIWFSLLMICTNVLQGDLLDTKNQSFLT